MGLLQQRPQPGAVGQRGEIATLQPVGEQRVEVLREIKRFRVIALGHGAQVVHHIARAEDQHAAVAQL